MCCQARKASVLFCAASFFAVGGCGGGRGWLKLAKRFAPSVGMVGGAPLAAPGLCHVPGCVRRGGGGKADVAAYGFPAVGGRARNEGYSPALLLLLSYFCFVVSSPSTSCADCMA